MPFVPLLQPTSTLTLPVDTHFDGIASVEVPSKIEIVKEIFNLLTNIRGEIVDAQVSNADREISQKSITEISIVIMELALRVGYDGANDLLLIDVRTQDGADKGIADINAIIRSTVEFAETLGGFEKPEPLPDPTELEAAEAILTQLLEIKAQMINSLSANVDLDKLQVNIEAAIHEIAWLTPFVEYDDGDFLSSINVWDNAGTQAQLDPLDAEIASLMGLIENLHHADGDQTVRGTPGEDDISTGRGDDIVVSGRGDDLVETGGGNDHVKAGRGDDFVLGGTGHDHLSGGRGDDNINGGEGDDIVRGGRGNDALTGAAGHDTITGGRGDDALFGDHGDDHLSGGRGNDALDGGSGDDFLRGGKGADSFVFEGAMGHDVILDFDTKQNDRLVFILDNDVFGGWSAQNILEISTQINRDVVIDFEGTGDTITLAEIDLATLNVTDFDVFFNI